MRRRLLFLLLCLLSLSPACAGTQKQPERQLELKVYQQSASQFVEALFAKQTIKVLERSGVPFYLNHQAILNYPEEWEKTLMELFMTAKATPVQIMALDPLTAKQMETEHPRDWSQLLQYGFEDKLLLLVTLQPGAPGSNLPEEKVLLLMDDNGKVVGFIR
ncbi:MAG: hypothetical protein ACAI44_27190 [Candidatus Sericytochromatia bacterium]